MPFLVTKKYGHEQGISCAFRQWTAESHCSFIHGYALAFEFEFECEVLDGNNWVVNFGGLNTLKDVIKETFDHKLVLAKNDPHLKKFVDLEILGCCDLVVLDKVGCEAFAEYAFKLAEEWLYDSGYAPRVCLNKVTVSEHGANSASYTGE